MYINQALMDDRSPIELQFMRACIDKLIYDKVITETTNYDNLKNTVYDCPRCHSKNYKKNGFNPKHRQKYRCKDCGAVFMATTGTFFSHSPAKFLTWVELDATYTKINLKGTKKEDMPRISKKRGKHKTSLVSKELAGISHHKVCIVKAMDAHDNILYRVAGQGAESQATFEQYASHFGNGSTVISDSLYQNGRMNRHFPIWNVSSE